jgi:hypothetical protein
VAATDLVAESVRLERALSRPPLIRAEGKRALDEGWPTGPFEDPDRWRARLRHHRGNVGLLMGRGMLAVDCDTYKPGGDDALAALVADTGLDLNTVTAITGRGGMHLLYSTPADVAFGSPPLTPRGYPHIEVKADGGYIMVEPSIADNGQPYHWEIEYGPGVVPFVPAPDPLLSMLDPSSSWRRSTDGEAHALDSANITVAELLEEHFGGHDVAVELGGYLSIMRPGKDKGSSAATIGYIAPGVVKVWSDGWPPFHQGGVYDLAQLRTLAGIGPRFDDCVRPLYVIPDGFRLWTPEDEGQPAVPVLDPAAFHGPVGTFLRHIEHQTEAALPAIGAMTLTQIGTLIGRRAAIDIGEHRHHANLFLAVVGDTSTGAKGTAALASRRLVERVCDDFERAHEVGGFGSGEALFAEVADSDEVVDKRKVVFKDEFSVVLKVARREGSILSDQIRKAFDYRPLHHRTAQKGKRWAHGHHISVIGSISPVELLTLSAELDVENGWLNRFLFVDSRLVRLLPFGGHFDAEALDAVAGQIRDALDALDAVPAVNGVSRRYELVADSMVGAMWEPWYERVRFGTGIGALAAVTRRQHVQAARLALIYAVLDRAERIEPEHLLAAQAWCDFGVQTAAGLFAPVSGNALKLLTAIRHAGEEGLSFTDQSEVFKRKLTAAQLDALRRRLSDLGLVLTFTVSTGGRDRTMTVALWRKRKKVEQRTVPFPSFDLIPFSPDTRGRSR